MFRTREPQESLWQSEFLITPRKCQGRRDIRPRGGAKVYHLSGDVQRGCPPATGALSGSEVGGVYASGESPAERVVAASLLCLRR